MAQPYIDGLPVKKDMSYYTRYQRGPSVFGGSMSSFSFYARDPLTGSSTTVLSHSGRVTVSTRVGNINHQVVSSMSFGNTKTRIPKYKSPPSFYSVNGKYLTTTTRKRAPNVSKALEFSTGKSSSKAFRSVFSRVHRVNRPLSFSASKAGSRAFRAGLAPISLKKGKYNVNISKLSKSWSRQSIGTPIGNRSMTMSMSLSKSGKPKLSKFITFKSNRLGSSAFKSLFSRIKANTGQMAFKLSKTTAKNFRNVMAFGGQAMGNFVGKGKYGNRSTWQSYFNSIAKNTSYNRLTSQTKTARGISSTVRIRGVNTPAEYRVTGLAGSYEKAIPGKIKTKPGWYQTMAYVNQTFINFDAYNSDGVTPRLVELQIFMENIQQEQFAKALRESIPASIKRLYSNKNYGHWAKNSPNWSRRKRQMGLDTRVMHMKNFITIDGKNNWLINIPLASAVRAVGNYIDVKVMGNGVVTVEGIDDAFKDNPYVWFHETGYRSSWGVEVPARPFIVPGINEGSAQAVRWLALRTPNRSPGVPTMRYRAGDMVAYSHGIEDAIKRTSRLIWWFMPPSEYWKYLGYYADIKGILMGYFMSTDSIMRFAWAFFRGKASGVTGIPFTEKFARRRFRYRLYTNTGRLPHG